MDTLCIQSIFKYLPPNYYLPFIAISKRYEAAIKENPYITFINKIGVKFNQTKTLTLYGDFDFDQLPEKTEELILLNDYPSSFVVKLLQKYTLKKLILRGIGCNTMGEFKHIHQLIGLQTQLTHLQYLVPPTDPSLMNLTSLHNLQRANIRLIPRIIPIVTSLQTLNHLSIYFGAQSIAKITEENNNTNPFKSLGSLMNLTSLKIVADSIKQLNSLNDLTEIKSLRLIDLTDVNISQATKLTFLTKIRNLQRVLLRVKNIITTPTELSNYLKLPSVFVIQFAGFHHDFECAKSFEEIEKIEKVTQTSMKYSKGELDSVNFWRNTSQFDKIFPIISHCCSINKLSITACPNFTNNAFVNLNLGVLRELTINQCLKIKNYEFLQECGLLTSLELHKYPIDQLSVLSTLKHTNLIQFTIGNIREFDCSLLQNLPSLLSLNFVNIPKVNNCEQLQKSNQTIQYMKIDNCATFNVFDISKLTRLCELSLTNVKSVETLVYVSLLQSLTRLDICNLQECQFQRNELFGIVGSKSLKALVVKDMPNFTMNEYNVIMESLPELKVIA